jgi:glycosyltransferase involved in cell wall biosynthesis
MISFRKNIENTPLVSVIICTYNREQYLSKAIDSVIEQTINFSIEIIVGDEASTDGTKEILLNYQKKYPELFTLCFHKINQGIGKNWASLMKLVKGKYVALCDDDDYWHYKLKLKKQVDILENDESIGLVHSNYRTENLKTGKFKEVKIQNPNSKDLLHLLFEGKYKIFTSTVMLRYSVIQKYVNLDDYFKYNFPLQDWVTWMLIAKYTKFFHLKISTLTYCLSDYSITRPISLEILKDKYEKDKIMYKYLCDKFSDELVYNEKEWIRFVNSRILSFAFKTADYQLAYLYGKKSKKINIKVIHSRNRLLFNFYLLMKKLHLRITNIM